MHYWCSLHELVDWSLRANKVHSAKSQLLSVQDLSGGVNSWLKSGQHNHLPSSAKDSTLIWSDSTSILHSIMIYLFFLRLKSQRSLLEAFKAFTPNASAKEKKNRMHGVLLGCRKRCPSLQFGDPSRTFYEKKSEALKKGLIKSLYWYMACLIKTCQHVSA